jgi:hypothetical protein
MKGTKPAVLIAPALRTAAAAFLALASVPAPAVVSLPFQRVNEMRTVINLPGLATALGVPIDRIVSCGRADGADAGCPDGAALRAAGRTADLRALNAGRKILEDGSADRPARN